MIYGVAIDTTIKSALWYRLTLIIVYFKEGIVNWKWSSGSRANREIISKIFSNELTLAGPRCCQTITKSHTICSISWNAQSAHLIHWRTSHTLS